VTVLASASFARAGLLQSAGVEFEIVPARIDEAAMRSDLLAKTMTPREIARELATAKALKISRHRTDVVIGADQTLDLDGETLGKVSNLDEARECLLRLRGRTHRLHSGAAIARNGDVRWRHVATASLTMRRFSDAFLDAYIGRCGDAILGSTGCYHFEGFGAQLFERVVGDYHAILGLPLIRLLAALRQERVISQ